MLAFKLQRECGSARVGIPEDRYTDRDWGTHVENQSRRCVFLRTHKTCLDIYFERETIMTKNDDSQVFEKAEKCHTNNVYHFVFQA